MINFLISSSVFILIVILIRCLCRKHISMRLQYMLWLLVAVKLLIFPVPLIESNLSIFNIPDKLEAILEQKTEEPDTTDDSAMQDASANTENRKNSNAAVNNSNADSNTDNNIENTNNAQNGNDQITDTNSAESSDTKAGLPENISLQLVLQVIAMIGCCAFLLFWIITNLKFRIYLKKHRIDITPYKIELPFEMELPVYVVPQLPAPCLYGSSIYITPDCTMNETKLRHILAHEYSHYRQKDLLWSFIRGICLSIYWWHPLVWAAAHLSKQDCELSCDETALKLLGEHERLDYGKTLLSLITVKANPRDYFSIATTMTKGKKSLKQRITMIAQKPRVMISTCILALFAVVLGLVCTSTAKRNEPENFTVASGTYTMEGTEDNLEPISLTINAEEQTLCFPVDPLSSYLPFCNYEIDGEYIKAETDDGLYHYTLKILDEESLMFVADESSEIIVIDEQFFTAPYDGAIFKLFEASTENASELPSDLYPQSYTREEILSWFNGTGEPEVDTTADPIWTEDGVLYYFPVKDEQMNDLQAFLLNYFDEDEVEELLQKKIGDYYPFMENDGVLYRGMGLVGNDTMVETEDSSTVLSPDELKDLAEKAAADNAAFYVDEQVGSITATEVDYDTFIAYIDARSAVIEQFGDYFGASNIENNIDYICNMSGDTILSLELRSPYPYISNLAAKTVDHSYYESFWSEEYYTLENTYEAVLNHTVDSSSENDKEPDSIEVYTGNIGDGKSGMVLIYSGYPSDNPFSIDAHTTRAGWKSIYLVTVDGKDYIFELHFDSRDNYGEASYSVYSLEEQTGPELAAVLLEGASFYWADEICQDSYYKWAERMNYYLKDAELLLSTQDGLVRTGGNDYDRYNGDAILEDWLETLAQSHQYAE